MILDLSKYKDTVATATPEDIAKASADYVQSMQPGTHEVVIHELAKMKVEGGEPSILVFNKKDPNWIQFQIVMRNAAGEQARQVIMLPVTGNVFYQAPGKEATSMPYKNLNQFAAAIGFDPDVEGLESPLHLAKLVVETGGSILEKLVGLQLKIQVKWPENMLHPYYDREQKVYFLVDSNNQLVSEDLSEPFTIDKSLEGNQRWAELELRCKQHGQMFISQPNITLMIHDTIKNDLTAFLPNKPAKPAAAFKAKPVAIAAKPPLIARAISQDATPPSE